MDNTAIHTSTPPPPPPPPPSMEEEELWDVCGAVHSTSFIVSIGNCLEVLWNNSEKLTNCNIGAVSLRCISALSSSELLAKLPNVHTLCVVERAKDGHDMGGLFLAIAESLQQQCTHRSIRLLGFRFFGEFTVQALDSVVQYIKTDSPPPIFNYTPPIATEAQPPPTTCTEDTTGMLYTAILESQLANIKIWQITNSNSIGNDMNLVPSLEVGFGRLLSYFHSRKCFADMITETLRSNGTSLENGKLKASLSLWLTQFKNGNYYNSETALENLLAQEIFLYSHEDFQNCAIKDNEIYQVLSEVYANRQHFTFPSSFWFVSSKENFRPEMSGIRRILESGENLNLLLIHNHGGDDSDVDDFKYILLFSF